jgi:DNA-binding XRE family transcriptional regulator
MARVAWKNLSLWKKIGSNIRSSRNWRGMTDVQASKRLGIDLKTYRKIEKGQTESVSLKVIMDIKNLFNAQIEEIIPLI